MSQTYIPIPATPRWTGAEELGYTPVTTFWQDFSIADKFGVSAVKRTYKSAMVYAKTDVRFLTELVLVLNHKIWQHYRPNKDVPLAKCYDELWRLAEDYAYKNLQGDELEYFYQTTD